MPMLESFRKTESLCKSCDYRVLCLLGACVVYAVFGSPTPDRFGLTEVVVSALLALSIGVSGFYNVFVRFDKRCFWRSSGRVFLLYGLSVPLLVGSMNGHPLGALVRDVFPFLCLFLPLLCMAPIRAQPSSFRLVLWGVLFIGLAFGARSLVSQFGVRCPFGLWGGDARLFYLENMPTVLFAALFLMGRGILCVFRRFSLRSVVVFAALMALACVPLLSMVMTLQRASIGVALFYVVVVSAYLFVKSPKRAVGVLFVGLGALFLLNISFYSVFASLFEKTRVVGMNMRFQEMEAVWRVVNRDPLTLLLGTGWGGQVYSPAVGGLSVNFTHNFFSSMLLKCGLIGVLLSVLYMAGLLERLSRVVLKAPVFGLALLFPVLIDLTLYASFKSLDFGLMLLMVSGSLVYFRYGKE